MTRWKTSYKSCSILISSEVLGNLGDPGTSDVSPAETLASQSGVLQVPHRDLNAHGQQRERVELPLEARFRELRLLLF